MHLTLSETELLRNRLDSPYTDQVSSRGSLTVGQDKEIKSKARNHELMTLIEWGTSETSIQY